MSEESHTQAVFLINCVEASDSAHSGFVSPPESHVRNTWNTEIEKQEGSVLSMAPHRVPRSFQE